ncbi:MAG: mechanosensitive ion channel family protein [Opitutales bacterium]|nr:mechanosensitive ion channel family protein [Opitutales bacterium]
MNDIFEQILEIVNWETLISSAFRITLIFVLAWILMLFVKKGLARLERRLQKQEQAEGEPPSESSKRVETIVRLLRQASFIAVWVTVILVVLREIGVEIAPIIASAGILGLAVGIGAQNLVRDIIAGFFFILENQVRVGDVAVVNGTGGLVEKINFRTIVLRDLGGVVHVFPNGTVTTLSNLTSQWAAYVFDIGVAYKENTDRVIDIMKDVGRELKEDKEFGRFMLEEPEVFGVDQFANSAVVIKGRIRTKPIRQWAVGREYLRRVKLAFDAKGIEIPFPHQTLYIGEKSKPLDLRILENREIRDSGERSSRDES